MLAFHPLEIGVGEGREHVREWVQFDWGGGGGVKNSKLPTEAAELKIIIWSSGKKTMAASPWLISVLLDGLCGSSYSYDAGSYLLTVYWLLDLTCVVMPAVVKVLCGDPCIRSNKLCLCSCDVCGILSLLTQTFNEEWVFPSEHTYLHCYVCLGLVSKETRSK